MSTQRMPLTKRQQEVYDYMRAFFERNDQLPSSNNLARHFGWGSTSQAQEYRMHLMYRGWIELNEVGHYRFTRDK